MIGRGYLRKLAKLHSTTYSKIDQNVWPFRSRRPTIASFMTAYLLDQKFHWSMVYYAGGVPTLLIGLLVILFMPESLRFLGDRGRLATALPEGFRVRP